jgi:hypothetical protein
MRIRNPGFKNTYLYMTVFDLQILSVIKPWIRIQATCLAPEPDSGFSESGYKILLESYRIKAIKSNIRKNFRTPKKVVLCKIR